MKIISFSGRAGSGKTTIVRELMRHLFDDGYSPVYLPFAQLLKEEAAQQGYGKETNPLDYRKFCQDFGAKKRQENKDYWIERWVEKYESHLHQERTGERLSETVILIDDCRYINETETVKDRGGKTIFVASGTRTLVDERAPWRKHESEALANLIEKTLRYKKDVITPFCQVFWNQESLEELEDGLVFAYQDWLEESPCDCELCKSRRENRKPNMDAIIEDIREILLSKDIDPLELFDGDT